VINTTVEWLPRPTYKQRVQRFRALLSRSPQKVVTRFSEYLTPENIQFFYGHQTKIQIVEALVGTLSGHDHTAVLRAIWAREREGALGIQPDISIVRGRIENTHHIRVALGICPQGVFDPSNACGMTRVFVLFLGPTSQTHLHANFLVAISALFHNRLLVDRLLKMDSSEKVLQTLQYAEGVSSRQNPLRRSVRSIKDFFRIHYGWGSSGTV
jgi:mannitol/fructose-specific phosphotransferase system IIA component (Ntr-type)